MLAITISCAQLIVIGLVLGALGPHCAAQSPASEGAAQQAYQAARAAFNRAQTDAAAAWKLGRAAFDLAELLDDSGERSQVANTGVEACRVALESNPDSGPAHYYLALNLGQVARSKKLGALRILHEMEHELLQARALEPAFDYAGPDRSLGLLYMEAPSWSIGNRGKARSHLEQAVQRYPDYPENQICLAEAYARWGETQNLENQLKSVVHSLKSPKPPLNEAAWQTSLRDWENRAGKLQRQHGRMVTNPRISPSERGARSP